MGLKGRIRRLERASREDMDSFELLDGSPYYFRRDSPDLFLRHTDCLRAGSAHNWPEPLGVVVRITALEWPYEDYISSLFSIWHHIRCRNAVFSAHW